MKCLSKIPTKIWTNSRMKPFQTVFIIIYVGSLFFCIFTHIESWPFSDYRVFPKAFYPKDISLRIPYFKLSSGEYFNPSTKWQSLGFDKNYFFKSFRELKPDDLESYLKDLSDSKAVKRLQCKMIARNLIPIKFVVMHVTFKERKKYLYEPVYTPEKEYELDTITKNTFCSKKRK